MSEREDIIVAPATATGGALSIVRVSGEGSIALCDTLFRGRKPLSEAPTHTLHYGTIQAGEELVDEVVVSLFRAPHSYTGEESVEISCHGSRYIVGRILALLIERGARMATAGEFSVRAFLNGRLDLAQSEAVADLIASESRTAHDVALGQMRGHFSERLASLRHRLLHLSSLLALELDFSEEDVTFADRSLLAHELNLIKEEIVRLEESFRLGNVLREGVPVAIVGAPNAGKSTLLNRLVGEERALVSDIAGTTRDTIEERIQIDGVSFRLIDTAGLHESEDYLEQLGMERTREVLQKAHIVLQIIDATDLHPVTLPEVEGRRDIRIYNKVDALSDESRERMAYLLRNDKEALMLSAKRGDGVDALRRMLRETVDTSALERGETLVTSARHVEALHRASEALKAASTSLFLGLNDFLAEDVRHIAHHLGTITGEITSDDILHSIFANFCIGK